ncbi:MAG TPA: hypothetical protein PLA85_00315 [Micropepsaceae bacterium]|nr:hypothetical protein [Micropepsaceae bacterium]HRK70000.1 hypothetical protein [Micropepsaceae bacterium]
MLLSTLMQGLRDETQAEAVLLTLDDLVLKAGVEDMRAHHHESAGEYAAGAVHRFSQGASDEDWLSLIPAIQKSDDPARAALSFMLRWAVAADRKEISGVPPCACGKAEACSHD